MASRMLVLVWLLSPAVCEGTLLSTGRLEAEADVPPKKTGVSQKSQSSITTVILTLQDIITSVQNDGKTEAAQYAKFQDWCKSQASTTSTGVEDAKSSVRELDVNVEQLKADILELDLKIKNLNNSIAESQNQMGKTKALAQKEDDKYTTNSAQNREALEQARRAIKMLEKAKYPSFLQVKRTQLDDPGESTYVLGVLKALKQNLEKTGLEMKQAYESQKKNSDNFLAATVSSLTSNSKDKTNKLVTLESKKVDLVAKTEELKQKKKEITDLEALGKQVSDDCAQKARANALRLSDRKKELEALTEATTFLTTWAKKLGVKVAAKKDKLLLIDVQDQEDGDATFGNGVSFLQGERSSAPLSALTLRLGEMVRNQHLDGAKQAVTNMIAQLQTDQKEEDAKLTNCNTDIAKAKQDLANTKTSLEASVAAINLKKSKISEAKTKIKTLASQISQLQKDSGAARDQRIKERKQYESETKDRKLTIAVLTKAIGVLERFYASQGALLSAQPDVRQKSKSSKALAKARKAQEDKPTVSTAKRKEAASNGAVAILKKVQADIKTAQKDADKLETKAKSLYQGYVDATKKLDAVFGELGDMKAFKAKTLVEVGNEQTTKGELDDKMTQQKTQLKTFGGACDELIRNHASREKHRSFEVAQLRDALDLLSGASSASRVATLKAQTSLLSKDDDGDQGSEDDAANSGEEDLDAAVKEAAQADQNEEADQEDTNNEDQDED